MGVFLIISSIAVSSSENVRCDETSGKWVGAC
jgi:hypothetical protein